jgi:hypothetical protein
MSSIYIAAKTDTYTTINSIIGTEVFLTTNTTSPPTHDYMVESYIDVSVMQAGDTTVITEYIAIDNTNYHAFSKVTLVGVQPFPLLRFHGKMLYSYQAGSVGTLYKIGLKQTVGTIRTYPYTSILQVFSA